ncbi:MAG TPA: DUF302 domain-containing protein [Euzebyales bacterium]
MTDVQTDRYTIRARVDADVETAEQRVRDALQDEGFGVLTEIDVKATLRDKLDVDVAPYIILGACNPPLAHRALEVDAAIGSLLPCNVVVRTHPQGGSEIIAADPNAMLALADNADIAPIAGEAAQRIQRAVHAAADR